MPVDASHDLYGLPLDQFIPERAALVKALRAEKQRDEAGEVAALRKPSVAAWAVNQLVRTQTSEIRALFQAGDRLVQAQADAAAGKRAGDAMRDATRAQRDAVDRLVNAAEGLLSSDGHPLSQTTLERVGDTLRAAAVDEEARRQVEEGCLTHELRFVGLGVGDALTSAAPARPAAKPKAPEPRKKSKQPKASKAGKATRAKADGPADADADADAAKREAAAAAAAQAEAERERKAALKAARQAETDARRAATRAEKELAAAQAKRDEAADALAQAEQRLTDAEHKAEQAAGELENAERAVHEVSA